MLIKQLMMLTFHNPKETKANAAPDNTPIVPSNSKTKRRIQLTCQLSTTPSEPKNMVNMMEANQPD